jgi:hypothetical protein
MEFLRMVGEPSRCQLLPASGPEISITPLNPTNSSQHLSGVIEAALPDPGAETASSPRGGTLPNASVCREYTRSAAAAKPESRFMSNL